MHILNKSHHLVINAKLSIKMAISFGGSIPALSSTRKKEGLTISGGG